MSRNCPQWPQKPNHIRSLKAQLRKVRGLRKELDGLEEFLRAELEHLESTGPTGSPTYAG